MLMSPANKNGLLGTTTPTTTLRGAFPLIIPWHFFYYSGGASVDIEIKKGLWRNVWQTPGSTRRLAIYITGKCLGNANSENTNTLLKWRRVFVYVFLWYLVHNISPKVLQPLPSLSLSRFPFCLSIKLYVINHKYVLVSFYVTNLEFIMDICTLVYKQGIIYH